MQVVVGDMLRSLEAAAADGSIDPPVNATLGAVDAPAGGAVETTGPASSKAQSWKEATASGADSRFKAPWQVFLDDLKKTTNDRLGN